MSDYTCPASMEQCEAEVARLEKERDAYKKAKEENDDRFMNERDQARAERDTLAERVRVLEAQASITDRLFLRVLSQALGENDNRELHHLFMSAYEQACEWVERKGYGVCTSVGARLKADPFDAEVSWDEMAALAQPQPCQTCGRTRRATFYSNMAGQYVTDTCPDCKGGWGKP